MKKICCVIGFLSLFFALSGCGKWEQKFGREKDGGFTSVSFKRDQNGMGTMDVLAGGILIYAYSQDFVTNIKMGGESDAGTLSPINLPNGNYSFYAFGYSSAFGGSFSDDNGIRCAVAGDAAPITLSGGATTISLVFRQSDCNTGVFTDNGNFPANVASGGTSAVFPKVDFVHCSSAAGSNLLSIAATQDCSTMGGTGISAPWSAVNKFVVRFPIYLRGPGGTVILDPNGLQSPCSMSFPNASGGTAYSEYKRLPLGGAGKAGLFAMEVLSFSDSSCTSAPIGVNRFHNGLAYGPAPDGSSQARVIYESGQQRTRIFLRQ